MLGKIMQKNNIMWRCLFTLLLALGGGIPNSCNKCG